MAQNADSNETLQLSEISQSILSIFQQEPEIAREMALVFKALEEPESPSPDSPSFAGAKLSQRMETSILNKILESFGEYNPDSIPRHVYDKMTLDPDINLARSFIILPIMAQNFRIDSNNADGALVLSSLIRPVYRDVLSGMMTAIDYGYAVGEKVFEKLYDFRLTTRDEEGREITVREGYTIGIKKVKFVPPETVGIKYYKRSEEPRYVVQKAIPGIKKAPKVKWDKVLWFTNDMKFGNYFGRSRLKAAYQPWYWYQIVVQFMLRYLDRRGSPTSVAKVPQGSTVSNEGQKIDNLTLGLQIARSVSSNSSLAIPSTLYNDTNQPKWSVDYLEDSQRGEMFLEALRFLSIQKMRAMLIPDKVGISEGSSTNATSVNNTDIHLLSEEALIQQIEKTFNESLVEPLIKYNWPPEERFTAQIKIERLNHGKRNLLRDVLLRMIMYAGGVSDSEKPRNMPSIRDMCEFLEIPYDEYQDIFSAKEEVDNENPSDNDKMNPIAKADAKAENNQNALTRKERTTRDVTDRKRYFEKALLTMDSEENEKDGD